MELLTAAEVHEFGVDIVGAHLEKEGYEIVSVQYKIEENPQIIARKGKRLNFITVRTACYPLKGTLESRNLAFQLIAHASEHKAMCYFASVGIGNASGKDEAEMSTPVKGAGFHVSFDGLEILTRSDRLKVLDGDKFVR